MSLVDLIHPECVASDLRASSKKQLFQDMARLIMDSEALGTHKIALRDVVSAAIERERLGSTGVGSGVALPHARIEGIDKVYAAFARLEQPLDYDAIDERPVDLVVMLIAPSSASADHLKALAQVSRRLRKDDVRTRLRAAPNAESLYFTLIDEAQATAA